jgi:hypothetical protein
MITGKAYKTLGHIKRTFPIAPVCIKKKLYVALVPSTIIMEATFVKGYCHF